MSYFNSITQDVKADPNNSSDTNLVASAVFSGSATSTLGVAGIQVSLRTDQNCAVYIDQAPHNTPVDCPVGASASTNNSTTMTGIGTYFTKNMSKGDTIIFDPTGTNQTRIVASVTSDTVLTVTSAFTGGALTGKVFQIYPWDIKDEYHAHTNDSFGITIQAVNSYVRVRVQNNGIVPTTYFRLQTALCPIVESLPRSLTGSGNLKVAIQEIEDGYGFEVENTPTDEMRVVIPYRLVGSSFTGSVVDTNYWIASSGSTSGSVVPLGSQVTLTTGSFSGGSSVLQSFRVARYIGGASSKFRAVIRLPDTGTVGNTRRWGAFTSTDGAFFQLSGSSLSVVTRKTGVDTPVLNGAFNGNAGLSYPLDTNVKTWEIYWTNSKVWFTAGGEVVHLVAANTSPWSDAMNLPIRFEDNSSSSGSSVDMNVRVATIYRLGNHLSQPTSYYFATGQTAGVQLKIGAGNLHSMIVSGTANNSVITLADSVNAATPVIYSSTATAATGAPVSIDFKGLPFFNGLRLIVATGNASATVIYE